MSGAFTKSLAYNIFDILLKLSYFLSQELVSTSIVRLVTQFKMLRKNLSARGPNFTFMSTVNFVS